MTGWYLLAIPIGGLGAVARVLSTRVGERHLPGGAATATALINVVGAGLVGVVAALAGDIALLVIGGGLLGGFTTFSTWMVEIDVLHRAGRWQNALLLIVLPTIAGAATYASTSAIF